MHIFNSTLTFLDFHSFPSALKRFHEISHFFITVLALQNFHFIFISQYLIIIFLIHY